MTSLYNFTASSKLFIGQHARYKSHNQENDVIIYDFSSKRSCNICSKCIDIEILGERARLLILYGARLLILYGGQMTRIMQNFEIIHSFITLISFKL